MSTKTKKTAPSPIPTREEFHRSYAGLVWESDFDTECRIPGGFHGYLSFTDTEKELNNKEYEKARRMRYENN